MSFAPRWSMNVSLCGEHESKRRAMSKDTGGTEAPASLGSDGLSRAPEPLRASKPQVSTLSSIFSSFSSLQSLCSSSGRFQTELGSSSAASRCCDPWAHTCRGWMLPARAPPGSPSTSKAFLVCSSLLSPLLELRALRLTLHSQGWRLVFPHPEFISWKDARGFGGSLCSLQEWH